MEEQAYKMPAVTTGMIVLWYQDGELNRLPTPAVVTKVEDRTLTVWLLNNAAVHSCNSVRHIHDPWLTERPKAKLYGTWDYTEETKQLQQFMAAIAAAKILPATAKPAGPSKIVPKAKEEPALV